MERDKIVKAPGVFDNQSSVPEKNDAEKKASNEKEEILTSKSLLFVKVNTLIFEFSRVSLQGTTELIVEQGSSATRGFAFKGKTIARNSWSSRCRKCQWATTALQEKPRCLSK
jgi:hypothetical protein